MTLAPALHSLPALLLATAPVLALLAMGRAGGPRIAGRLPGHIAARIGRAPLAHAGMAATALALGSQAFAVLQLLAGILCLAVRSGPGRALLARGLSGSVQAPAAPQVRRVALVAALALALPLAAALALRTDPHALADPWLWMAAFLVAALTERAVAAPRAPLAAAAAFAILLLAALAA